MTHKTLICIPFFIFIKAKTLFMFVDITVFAENIDKAKYLPNFVAFEQLY